MFTSVQLQFAAWLQTYRTDLGGKKNFHNGVGGTYDCIMIFAYYTVCREMTSFKEIETIMETLFMDSFRLLSFANLNNKLFKRLMYSSLVAAKKRCDRWHDYEMVLEPYEENEPLRYHFTACPVAQFAHDHDLLEILPALCNVDYPAIETLHGRLVRTTTLCHGGYCDYAICGSHDPYLNEHPEYRDETGGRWNH